MGWRRGRQAGVVTDSEEPLVRCLDPGVAASWAPGPAVSSSLVLSCSQSRHASEGIPVTCHQIPWEASRTAAGRAASRLHLHRSSPAQRGAATALLSPRHPDDLVTLGWICLLQGPSASSPLALPAGGLPCAAGPSAPPASARWTPAVSSRRDDQRCLRMVPTVPWWATPTPVEKHCSLIQH